MTTMLETLATGVKHDPSILLPNTWYDLLHHIEALCPCGNTTSVQDGALTTHGPKSTWDLNGQRRAVISDAYNRTSATCRYSGRTVTLDAALQRDNVLTPAERHTRNVTQSRLEAGITNTAPEGYALPKPVAGLFAHAEANGWKAQQAWAPRDDGFVVNLRVSRSAGEGRGWQYDLGYFVAPGIARRTRSGLCTTPDRRGLHDTPSLKAIRDVITVNPAAS